MELEVLDFLGWVLIGHKDDLSSSTNTAIRVSGVCSSIVSDSKDDVWKECRVRGSGRKLGQGGVGEFREGNSKCRGPVGLSIEG